jgi:glycosyltransferase involved in cell wall biosynthesis
MKKNKFTNINAETYLRWIFRKNESLNQIVFYFLSQANATSPRFFPLFEASSKIRIVYIKGLNVPKTDYFVSRLANFLYRLAMNRFEKYECIHIVGGPTKLKNRFQVLHLDDPNYSQKENDFLLNWEKQIASQGLNSIIICTNDFTKQYLETLLNNTLIIKIEQGYDSPSNHFKIIRKGKEESNFSCVYSSPYIHIRDDKHANHQTWGADLLLNNILPELYLRDPTVKVHLIGELGKCAKSQLMNIGNIVYHGRVNFEDNMNISSACSIGIYARNIDYKRSMSKIFTYIGAGLPIVTFDLYDTKVVKEHQLGYSVSSVKEFVDKIIYLKDNPHELELLRQRVNRFKPNYTWENLSKKMEDHLSSKF